MPKSQRQQLPNTSEQVERSRSPRFIPRRLEPVNDEPAPLNKQKPRRGLKFQWDNEDDTSQDSLYPQRILPKALGSCTFGKTLEETQSIEDKPTSQMTARDWKIFKENHGIVVTGAAPEPIRQWIDIDLPRSLRNSLKKLRYARPTSIQMQAIPAGLELKDVIGLAPTGSGKSVAYLLPLLAFLNKLPRLTEITAIDGPYALIIAPTRELAIQIHETTQVLDSSIRSTCIVGGRDIESQLQEILKGAEVVIGTPGRLLDCLERAYLVFNQCVWLVIDEADKLVLLELMDTVQEILKKFPEEAVKRGSEEEVRRLEQEMANGRARARVTQLFSATMDPQIEQVWKETLHFPVCVSIGDPSTGYAHIKQTILLLTDTQKNSTLKQVLSNKPTPIIVFASQRDRCDSVVSYLKSNGFQATTLHGGKSQEARENILSKFKHRRIKILVATDLASRGLDVEGLKCVVNYDAPNSIVDYEHRIGRTGRMGKNGEAITFLTAENENLFADLAEFLKKNKQKVPKELAQHSKVSLILH